MTNEQTKQQEDANKQKMAPKEAQPAEQQAAPKQDQK